MSKHASLICYIGNGVVKGSVAIIEKNKKPVVLTTRIHELSVQEFVDRDHLEHRVMAEFTDLIKEIKFKDLASPECKDVKLVNACVILASPWYVSETKVVKIEHDQPFVVTEKILNGAIAASAADYIQKKQQGLTVLEQNVIRYTLNGYHTTAPLKKEAQFVDMSVFMSYCSADTIIKVKQTILSHLGLHQVLITSQSLAAFVAVQETWKDIKSYVLADISSQLTELMIVRDGALAEAASFPLGKQYVVTQLGKWLGTSAEVSLSMLAMYKSNTIEPNFKEKIEQALISIRQDWLRPFTNALGEMSVGSSLPSRIFLFSPKDAEWLFSQFIKEEAYQQFTFSEGKFEVYDVKPDDFLNSYELRGSSVKDISVAVGTIFLHKKIQGVI